MSVQPFLVASSEVGLEKDMEPWLLPDTAFPALEDAYVFRKRVKRRLGNEFLGRLSQQITQIYPLAVTGADTGWTSATGLHHFPVRPKSVTITVNAVVFLDRPIDNYTGNIIAAVGGTVVGTINYLTGMIVINPGSFGPFGGGPYNVTVVYSYYPNLSVMGLPTKENFNINAEDLIAFNTTKSNIWNVATEFFDDISYYDHSAQEINWTGADYNFFDYENLQGAFLATNNIPGHHVQNITNVVPVGANARIDFVNNILDVGDRVFLTNIVGTTPALGAALNNKSYTVIAPVTATSITVAENIAALVYSSGGTAFMPQHSGYNAAQTITGVTVGTSTTISFAANTITTGQIVYIKWIAAGSTVSTVLNDKTFVVLSSTATDIEIDADTTGLTWVAGGGLVVRPVGDGIRWYANDASVNGWVNFNSPLNSATALKGGRILLGYKDRLVVLSTFEGSITGTDVVNYTNRARWSQNGTIFNTGPVPVNQGIEGIAWDDSIPGRGGYIDAPTTEAIISADFIRDTLVVFFERTTWALRYTGNESLPFVWVRINIEFGSGSQFSSVPFDRGVLTVGNRGIITSDGNNVERIDLKIPYTAFDFSTGNNNNMRVHGIRDYYNELVYWTYIDRADAAREGGPPDLQGVTYPNKMLVYNYRENSYSIFNDAYTCFGYFTETTAVLWNTAKVDWDDAAFNWNSAQGSANFPIIVAGTNAGYVMMLRLDTCANDTQIPIAIIASVPMSGQTLVTTLAPHNLLEGQYVKFSDVLGMTAINGLNTKIILDNALVALPQVQFLCDIDSSAFGAYTFGTGQLIRINNFNILTKRFNPFATKGKGVFINKADFYTDYIKDGRISVNVFVNDNSTRSVNEHQPGGQQFWEVVFPLDQNVNAITPTDKTWTRFFCHVRGQFIQLQFTLNDSQMLDDKTNTEEFALHGMVLWMGMTGRLISR